MPKEVNVNGYGLFFPSVILHNWFWTCIAAIIHRCIAHCPLPIAPIALSYGFLLSFGRDMIPIFFLYQQ